MNPSITPEDSIVRPRSRDVGCRALLEQLEPRQLLAVTLIPKFTWSLPARYGVDTNRNRLIDLPNSKAYANPSGFSLDLYGKITESTRKVTSYRWTVKSDGKTVKTASGYATRVNGLAQGSYEVTLAVTDSGGLTRSVTQPVHIRDVLIVSLGDSYASGEGNPEIPKQFSIVGPYKSAVWADGVSKEMTLENRAAHRSTLCASSQAALSLEKSDPHFSVTYIQLSASGATIDNVMFARRDASEVRMASLPPQLTELKSIVGFRPIDLLTLSVGGNDMGFADCVIELLKRDDNEAHSALIGGKKLSDIKKDVDANLAKLPTRYANLNRWLSPFNIGRTIITEYPDPTRGDDGQTTTFAADYVNAFDVVPFIPGKLSLEIDKGEADFVVNNVLKPLNTHVASAAKANGWQFVTGIASDFRLHGYAASDHWFRTEDEASRRQGANMDMISVIHYSTGGLHPNEQGHKAIASRLLQSMNQYVAGDLAVYTAAAASRTNIAYRGTDGHIHWRFRSGVSGAWQDTNITRMTGSRLAASGPAAYIWDRDGSQHILYRGTDGNIYELYNKKNTLLWQSNNLTSATKADRAAAGSNPTAYTWDVDKSQHVIYVGIDRHVHELCFTVASGVWRHNDLTKVTGAALAEFSTPAGYTWSVDSSQHIAYISTDRHIHEMYFTRASGKWRDNDLGSLANDAIGAPAAYTRSVDDSQHIIYRSAANRICELWLSRRYPTWHRNDVVSTGTKYASNPVGYTWSVDNSQHIIYRSEDNHIHELWMSLKNPRWHDNDLGSLAADAVGNLAAYTWNVDNGQHIVYRASNGRLGELWLNKADPRWHLSDLGMF